MHSQIRLIHLELAAQKLRSTALWQELGLLQPAREIGYLLPGAQAPKILPRERYLLLKQLRQYLSNDEDRLGIVIDPIVVNTGNGMRCIGNVART